MMLSKNKKKRTLLVLLLMAVSLSVMVFAGGTKEQKLVSNEASKQAILLRVTWWGSQARNDRTVTIMDLYAKENSRVSFQPEFSDWGGYWQKLATQVAGNSLPDIIQMDRSQLYTYVSKNQLLDLTPYIESGVLDTTQIAESIVNTGKVGDGIYAFPLGINVHCMVYDKDVVAAAGLEIKNGLTYAEFFDMSRKIYERTGVQTDLAYGRETIYLSLFLREKGYSFYAADGTRLGIPDYSLLTEFYQLYVDGLAEGYMVPPKVFTEYNARTIEENTLTIGKSWCTILSSNEIWALAKASGKNIGITSVPADNLKQLQYIKPSMYFSISANSSNPEAAAEFISWFVNSREANDILLAERGAPPNSEIAEHIAPDLNETERLGIAFIDTVRENSSDIDPPEPLGAKEISSLVSEIQEAVCYGILTAEEGGQRLFRQANEILAANKK